MEIDFDSVPRRNRVDLMSSGELAIKSAIDVVECMGCDSRLTEAIILLARSKDKVADFVDGKHSEEKDLFFNPLWEGLKKYNTQFGDTSLDKF